MKDTFFILLELEKPTESVELTAQEIIQCSETLCQYQTNKPTNQLKYAITLNGFHVNVITSSCFANCKSLTLLWKLATTHNPNNESSAIGQIEKK